MAWLVLLPTIHLCASLQAPLLLHDLRVGDALPGKIVHRHNRKLFLEVPVTHTPSGAAAATAAPKEIRAYTRSLPPKHELLNDDNINGLELTVYVHKVQPEAARLCVDLRDPALQQQSTAPMENAADALPHRLESLTLGEPLEGTVVAVKDFGVFLDCGVSRRAAKAQRRPVDAFLPRDQMSRGSVRPPQLGETVAVRVLNAAASRGRLMVTARALNEDAVADLLAERAEKARRDQRRPSLSSMKPGVEREGVVVEMHDYGVTVNVGARKTGLVHISQLREKGPRGGNFVAHPSEVCDVGDSVIVRVLPRTNSKRLSLRLVKVFPRDTQELIEQRATLRKGETLEPRFVRKDDDDAEEVAEEEAEEEDPFAWAASSAEEDEDEDEDDPFAWAAKDAPAQEEEEEEDPFAWAAASEVDEDKEEEEAVKEEEEEDGFDEDYFNDKYEEDFY